MKRILVGVDGSPESKNAAETAAEIAASSHAVLDLVYVIATPVAFGPEVYGVRGGWEDADRDYGDEVVRELRSRCAREGLSIETDILAGPPAERLATLAREKHADLVAVGHRGRGGVTRFLLGSVADRLTQIAPCPVLVCRT